MEIFSQFPDEPCSLQLFFSSPRHRIVASLAQVRVLCPRMMKPPLLASLGTNPPHHQWTFEISLQTLKLERPPSSGPPRDAARHRLGFSQRREPSNSPNATIGPSGRYHLLRKCMLQHEQSPWDQFLAADTLRATARIFHQHWFL
eukprot:15236_3